MRSCPVSPLTDLAAIELPFERQRRVAIAALSPASRPVARRGSFESCRLTSTTSRVPGVSGCSAVSSPERGRPGRSSHTWRTGRHGARRRLQHVVRVFRSRVSRDRARLPGTVTSDRRATFRGLLRLDHIFFRLPTGWRAHSQRGSSRFGSDHFR